MSGGGVRAQGGGRAHLCVCYPGALPRCGGECDSDLCETKAGWGGWLEGPPVWGPAGPRFPLLPAAAPP